MKKTGLFVLFITCAFVAGSQTLGGYAIHDYIVTTVHPYGCDPNYVTGPPEDSTWVNFNPNDTMTGTFGSHWTDAPGDELLLETSYHPGNYDVRLLLSTGQYSGSHGVRVSDWEQIADTPWVHLFTNCTSGMQSVERYIHPLDFNQDFGLTSSDEVTGIEIVFLATPGAPDLAGVYIIAESPPCDSVDLGPDTTLCQGETLLLDATTPNATYLWQDNSTNPTFTVTQSGTYWVQVSVSNCITTDTIQIFYTPLPVVTNNPLSKVICSGESTNIPLTSNVPNTVFSWSATGSSLLVTGFSPGTGDTIAQILTNTGSGTETVTYTITPAVGICVGDSVNFVVTVTPGDSVEVSIVASADSVCEGIPMTLTGVAVNGGSTPVYQWQLNGINVGTNNPVYTFYPASGNPVSCILTSSILCPSGNPASSNPVLMIVNPLLPVSITISLSVNPVCEGIPVTSTANPINGGTSPVYQWQVNGINIGTNNPVYTYLPMTNDLMTCTLTSSEQCTTNNPTSGNPVTMTVIAAPIVTFTPCFNTITTTNAKPIRLKGGIPLGGTYSGPGLSNGYFYPALGGPGVKIITYT
ncbi:MAG: PKD-like domain-containing protein [bacterium]